MIGAYEAHCAPAKTGKRGNPSWGSPIPFAPALPTEFELRVKQLHLTPYMFTSSVELHSWCQRNKDRRYIPEWLLKEWDLIVNPNLWDPTDHRFSHHTSHHEFYAPQAKD